LTNSTMARAGVKLVVDLPAEDSEEGIGKGSISQTERRRYLLRGNSGKQNPPAAKGPSVDQDSRGQKGSACTF